MAKASSGTKKVTPSAKPNNPGKGDKAEKESKRQEHPLVGVDDSDVYPFTDVPEDFDYKAHRPLKKVDFRADHFFFAYKASEAEYRAADFRDREEEARTLGSSKERGKAKRLIKMQEKMEELRASLESDGVDVDAVLTKAAQTASTKGN